MTHSSSSSSFSVSLRSFGGFTKAVDTTSDSALSAFITDVANTIGVAESSMRIFLPNGDVLPSHSEVVRSPTTVEASGISSDGDTTLRIMVSGLREENDKPEYLRISTSLPHASQFLLWAAREGRDEVGLAIIGGSPFVDGEVSDALVSRNNRHMTPLMIASQNDHIGGGEKLFVALLAAMTDEEVSLKDRGSQTALFNTKSGSRAELLVSRMSDEIISSRNHLGQTALHAAAFFGRADVMRVLIASMSEEIVSSCDNDSSTALVYIVAADVNRVMSSPKRSNGPVECARLLIDAMSRDSINRVNSSGATAFFYAAVHGHVELMRMLVQYLPSDYVIDRNILQSVITNNNNNKAGGGGGINDLLEIMKVEEIAKPDPHIGQTALHVAVIFGNDIAVTSLLRFMSADVVAIRDKKGKTALHYAVERKNETVVELLRAMSADAVAIRDNDGKTALHHSIMCYSNDRNTVSLMRAMSAVSVEIRDNRGKTAFQIAIDANRRCPLYSR